ncbi:MAG TPA: general stress protein [Tissierellaceae bacterium]|nr:general stress protein [Tissierellaceae bacterium]
MLNKKFEVLNNDMEVIHRINELKDLGYKEEDMYVITQEEDNVSMLKGYTDVIIKEEDHSIFERFKSFLQGEESIYDAFRRLGLEKDEKKYYYNEVQNGRLLLLVDPEYKDNYILGEDGIFRPREEIEDFFEENKDNIPDVGNIQLEDAEDLPSNIKEDIGVETEDKNDPSTIRTEGLEDESYRS